MKAFRKFDFSLIFFIIALIVWVAAASFLGRPFVGDSGDDGQYLVSARSLVDGNGYRLPSRPGNPVATKYPIGTSALAAVVIRFLPGGRSLSHDNNAGRTLVVVAGLVLGVVCRRLMKSSGLDDWSATLLALTMVWHPYVLDILAIMLGSDLLFAAVSTLLLFRWVRRARSGAAPVGTWAVDGLLAAAGHLIRGNGITLIVTALIAAYRSGSGRWRAITAVLVSAACLWLPLTIHKSSMSGPRDTGNYLTEQIVNYRKAPHLWSLPLTNLTRIPDIMVVALVPPTQWTKPVGSFLAKWPAFRWTLSLAVMGVFLVGVKTLIDTKTWPLVIWLNGLATLMVFILWHYPIDIRFLLPLVPFFYIACANGIKALTRRNWGSLCLAGGAFAASILVAIIIMNRAISHGGMVGGGRSSATVELFEMITAKSPPDSVILCVFPELIYLYTGRLGASSIDDELPSSEKPSPWNKMRYWIRLSRGRPVYLLDVADRSPPFFTDIEELRRYPEFKLDLVGECDGGKLWKVTGATKPSN